MNIEKHICNESHQFSESMSITLLTHPERKLSHFCIQKITLFFFKNRQFYLVSACAVEPQLFIPLSTARVHKKRFFIFDWHRIYRTYANLKLPIQFIWAVRWAKRNSLKFTVMLMHLSILVYCKNKIWVIVKKIWFL